MEGVRRLYIAGMLIKSSGSSEKRSLFLPCGETRHCSTGNLGQLRWKDTNRKCAKKKAKKKEKKMN